MIKDDKKLYRSLDILSRLVTDRLKNRGMVVPTRLADGRIKIGRYVIVRQQDGHYSVNTIDDQIVIDHINLPHTAIVIANDLALGRWLDNRVVSADQMYGYADFEECMHRQYLDRARSQERAGISLAKISASQVKKQQHKQTVIDSFEKLKMLA